MFEHKIHQDFKTIIISLGLRSPKHEYGKFVVFVIAYKWERSENSRKQQAAYLSIDFKCSIISLRTKCEATALFCSQTPNTLITQRLFYLFSFKMPKIETELIQEQNAHTPTDKKMIFFSLNHLFITPLVFSKQYKFNILLQRSVARSYPFKYIAHYKKEKQ